MTGTPIARRELLQAGLLVATAGITTIAVPRRNAIVADAPDLESAVPEMIGAWRHHSADGVVLPPADELSERLYDGVLARTYVAPGRPPVMLLIAYGAMQEYERQLHRPEGCYPAAGYALDQVAVTPLSLATGPDIPAVTMTARREGRREQILYWTRIGDSYPTDEWRERIVILRAALGGNPVDGVLVRLSTPMADTASALPLLRMFNSELLLSLKSAGRRLLLGA